MAEQQLNLFGPADEKPATRNHLATPLTREESRKIGKMYAENIRLVGKFQAKMREKYGKCLPLEDINSAVDIAFIKAARIWNPERGAFSTILGHFAAGEVRHAIKAAGNWGVAATQRARLAGMQARRMLEAGMAAADVCREMAITEDDLLDVLRATTGLAHDVQGFELHLCPRPTPWELLEGGEAN